MSGNKGGDVTWSEENDADLCDDIEDTPNPSQTNDYANSTSVNPPLRARHHLSNPPVLEIKNEPQVPVHDLRTMLNRLSSSSTSVNNLRNLERSQHSSETSTGTTSHTDYPEWKSETDWRTLTDTRTPGSTNIERRGGDLRHEIEMSKLVATADENLESPDTNATGMPEPTWASSSRPVASGIKLVAVRSTSTQRLASSTGRPSSSDVIANPKRDSRRQQSRSRSRSRGRESSRRENSRSRSREHSWNRSRRRSWSRSGYRVRSRSRDRPKERETSSRYRSRSGERSRSRGRDSWRSRESRSGRRNRDWSRSRSRERSWDRNRGRERRSRSTSRSRSSGQSGGKGKSQGRGSPIVKEEENKVSSIAPGSTSELETTQILTTGSTASAPKPTSLTSLSASLVTTRSPTDQPTVSSLSTNSARSNSKPLSSSTKTVEGPPLQFRQTVLTTMASSDTASTSTSNQLQDTDMTVRVKIEPEAPPTVAQLTQLATNLSLVNVKEEPLDDATNNTQLTTLQATIPSEPELSYHEQPEIVIPQDTHYFVIRVTDEGDFLDARKSNVWPTNPLYDKALRQLYSPTSRIFLIFTVFMSNGFCGIARMASEMMWVGERTIFDKSLLRQKFKLEWVACSYVSYDSVKMVTHEPVYKIIRKTGYKLTTEMGSAIHKILVENQPKEDPQLTLSLQTEISDFSALDTNLSQATLMDRGREHRDDSLLQISALPRDTSNMDDDIQKEQMPTVLGEKEDDDAKRTSSTMDLDSDPGIDMVAFPRSTPPRSRSPLVRKRSISADEDTDLSTEKQLAYEDQLTRGRSPERGAERADLQTEEVEEYPHPPTRHHSPPSPRKISPPPPTKNRSPPPARNRSPPPARNRSPPPARNRSPPPARNRSPPPPRRNRPPPPPSQRSSSLPRRRSPPPYRQPAYDRAGSSTSTSSYGTSGTFRSTPPFPQRSKDPRDRSSTVYVFHTGSSPSHQRDQFNAPTDPRLSGRAIIPQKRPFDGSPAAVDSKDGGVLSEEVDMPASVFPLEDDFDEDFSVGGTGAGPSSSSSSSLSSAMVVRSHSAAVMSEAPPPQIKSITLVPAGMSKSRRKKLRKEALSKPLDF